MDTHRATRHQPAALRPTGTEQAAEPDVDERDSPVQQPLPFDDEADRPVSFALTARAKRVVAPQDLPSLSVVRDRVTRDRTGAVADDWPTAADPSDTRPSRARALHRAGRSASAIAEHLAVDPLLVRAWVGSAAGPAVSVVPAGDDRGPSPSEAARSADDGTNPHHQETAFHLGRAAANEEARDRLRRDPGFAAGLGLLTSIAEVDRHAVTATTCDQDVAAAVLMWMDGHLAIDPGRVRVVLRVGPRGAGDLVRHRWAARLGIDRDRIAVARWREASDPEAVQALVRVADPAVAATVAGWRDALLAPPGPDPAGVAF